MQSTNAQFASTLLSATRHVEDRLFPAADNVSKRANAPVSVASGGISSKLLLFMFRLRNEGRKESAIIAVSFRRL
jgi:hypothetical protein